MDLEYTPFFSPPISHGPLNTSLTGMYALYALLQNLLPLNSDLMAQMAPECFQYVPES